MIVKGGKKVDYQSKFANKLACSHECPCYNPFIDTSGTYNEIVIKEGISTDFNLLEESEFNIADRTKGSYYYTDYIEPAADTVKQN